MAENVTHKESESMFLLFKQLRNAFWIGGIIISIPYCVAGWLYPTLETLLWSSTVCLLLWGWSHILNKIAFHWMDSYMIKWLHNNQASNFVRSYEELLSQPYASHPAIRRELYFQVSIGYSALGNHRLAIELTKKILPLNTKTRRGYLNSILFYNNMITYYIRSGDADNAAKSINDLRQAFDRLNKESKHYTILADKLTWFETQLAVLNGNEHVAYESLETAYTNAPTPYRRVASGYTLALAYLQLGETEKVIPILETMVTQGGDTFFAAWAAERLKEWQNV